MRNWLFHPLIFYPLAALFAALVIAVSIEPQKWARPAAPVEGAIVQGALVLEGAAFNSPDDSPEQEMTVVRDFLGRAQTLRIAVKPEQPAPTPAEQGIRVELSPNAAAVIGERPVRIEVSYNPLPVNPADALAVSLQGIAPADWVTQPIPPQSGMVAFDVPASTAVNAIGLRAISAGEGQTYGLEITRIKVIPQGS
ncbi:hypothetical protein U91I_01625 [alpha proteobacterium U9-1i]|nr:hypothetical protein U91I_01625 [alpha proteobacterium U9-1i]